MRQLRLFIISIATICAFALAAFALVTRPPVVDPDDDIIIKGGSLDVQCGKNHGLDCLGTNDSYGKYKHKQSAKHITKIVIKRADGIVVFNSDLTPIGSKPEIALTYR